MKWKITKQSIRPLSQAETACLLAILIMVGIGCERQAKISTPKRDTVKVDTTSFITEHSEIGKDSLR
jgi:hypothetical protein